MCRSSITIGRWSTTLCAAIIDYGKRSIYYPRKIRKKKTLFKTGVLSFQRNADDILISWFNSFLIHFVCFFHVLKHGTKMSVSKKRNQKFKLLWFAHRWKMNGLLRAFSNCYRWSIDWVNPIISDWDDRLWNRSRLQALKWSQPDLRKYTLPTVRR